MIPIFKKGYLPPTLNFRLYRKKTLTQATRIDGPFTVQTRHGSARCEDGWLCLDHYGYLYPVADDEFREIYEVAP
jgi:hypothetical protein